LVSAIRINSQFSNSDGTPQLIVSDSLKLRMSRKGLVLRNETFRLGLESLKMERLGPVSVLRVERLGLVLVSYSLASCGHPLSAQ